MTRPSRLVVTAAVLLAACSFSARAVVYGFSSPAELNDWVSLGAFQGQPCQPPHWKIEDGLLWVTATHWDERNDLGEAVAGGIYFLELSAGGVRDIRRMMLVK